MHIYSCHSYQSLLVVRIEADEISIPGVEKLCAQQHKQLTTQSSIVQPWKTNSRNYTKRALHLCMHLVLLQNGLQMLSSNHCVKNSL